EPGAHHEEKVDEREDERSELPCAYVDQPPEARQQAAARTRVRVSCGGHHLARSRLPGGEHLRFTRGREAVELATDLGLALFRRASLVPLQRVQRRLRQRSEGQPLRDSLRVRAEMETGCVAVRIDPH